MDGLLIAGGILALAIILFLLFKLTRPESTSNQSVQLMQREIETLRSELRSGMQTITASVNQQLTLVSQHLHAQTQTVDTRLDSTARIMGDVQRNLGELERATQEIKELGQSVSKLDELLQAPKLRGGMGEYLLEELLRQILPAEHFQMQYRFRSGHVVDAVVFTSDHLVPVDSKFPLENFRRMMAGSDDAEQREFRRAFIGDVKKHIDAIAAKYILPDEGTFPFALMYIPAENIYYEIIVRGDGLPDSADVYSYALARKVIPVSPNSFYAYLQVIALGLRGLAVESSVREIADTLIHLQVDLAKLQEAFDTLGMHLDKARKKFDDADRKLRGFGDRLEGIAGPSLPSSTRNKELVEMPSSTDERL